MRTIVIPDIRCVPFFTDMLISVDEPWQLSRFDIRFKDIHEIQRNTDDGAIGYSLLFIKRGGLFI